MCVHACACVCASARVCVCEGPRLERKPPAPPGRRKEPAPQPPPHFPSRSRVLPPRGPGARSRPPHSWSSRRGACRAGVPRALRPVAAGATAQVGALSAGLGETVEVGAAPLTSRVQCTLRRRGKLRQDAWRAGLGEESGLGRPEHAQPGRSFPEDRAETRGSGRFRNSGRPTPPWRSGWPRRAAGACRGLRRSRAVAVRPALHSRDRAIRLALVAEARVPPRHGPGGRRLRWVRKGCWHLPRGLLCKQFHPRLRTWQQ